MTKFSGGFTGKVNWQTNVSLPHMANHELNLAEVSGIQDCSDGKWKGAVITYWNMSDIIGDKSTYHAYYTNIDKDGDRDWGRIEGKTFNSGGQVKVEGTWILDGGNGKFKGIKGKGTVKGHMISPTEVRIDWEGEYEI
ncbi:MAG: hypothetical protein HYW01_05210 [Deltaproteobacteria bacterium]|nr:hypothetical protein [Deltaproteobacteria bacterium]